MEWRTKCGYVGPFLAILLLHSLAILLFTRGFLLTRTELPVYSHCSDLSSSNATSSDRRSEGGGSHHCWTKPAVDRVVIIVLDALRFDFVAPSSFFDERKPWMDKLTVLQKLAFSGRSSVRLFKAFADPPTTSLQRLKGLTTGGLPTFIDVGNSFGAPAIVEDNLMYQLSSNGKRVLMMGDDTWLQLFPSHFEKSYPYPSFNVKDLDTVDDGCIKHLFPSLYKQDWDVLIAHFLGVDHAGHIYGVDSAPMIHKLEQYNSVLEEVVEVLRKHSGPGGLHENTLLIVMGDHGQTTNGDHGGGTPEEVETSLFAMNLKAPPVSISSILSSESCGVNVDGEKICVGSIQQIDFASTISALLGIPFPFGSIGHVNPELYALSTDTWEGTNTESSNLESWMQNYVNTLQINCWQVKRYIDLYSATSVIGFPSEDLQHVAEMYNKAQSKWTDTQKTECLFDKDVSDSDETLCILQKQIDTYLNFLESVAELARSKWTEFDMKMMTAGLGILFLSLIFHFSAIVRTCKFCQSVCLSMMDSWTLFKVTIPLLIVAIRASSFLSNSYILAEGKVANFLLATAAIISTQHVLVTGKISVKDAALLVLTVLQRIRFETVLSKQILGSTSMNIFSLDNLRSTRTVLSIWIAVCYEILPIALLVFLSFLLYRKTSVMSCWRTLKIFITGAILSYSLTAVHWASESNLIAIPDLIRNMGRTFVPRTIYFIGLGLVLLAITRNFEEKEKASNHSVRIVAATVAMLCACSSSIMVILGRQGPFVAFVSLFGAWSIIRSQKASQKQFTNGIFESVLVDPMSVTEWSLLAVCLFFYTGHWCNFDGLRYGAAFIGFDQFNLVRQGILLAIDTFGVSHILPIFSLPFLLDILNEYSGRKWASPILLLNLTQVFLVYGLITALTTTFTIVCVTIQRRHLMVWGLFAPKYVFDVVGLLLTDVLIFLASLYYF